MTTRAAELSAKEWWSRQRGWYNAGLVLAGLGAFFAYAGVLTTRCRAEPDVEITIFTIAINGIGYLFAMGLANLLYGVGAEVERLVRPRNVGTLRRWTFGLGVGFSVTLPFAIPVYLAIVGCA